MKICAFPANIIQAVKKPKLEKQVKTLCDDAKVSLWTEIPAGFADTIPAIEMKIKPLLYQIIFFFCLAIVPTAVQSQIRYGVCNTDSIQAWFHRELLADNQTLEQMFAVGDSIEARTLQFLNENYLWHQDGVQRIFFSKEEYENRNSYIEFLNQNYQTIENKLDSLSLLGKKDVQVEASTHLNQAIATIAKDKNLDLVFDTKTIHYQEVNKLNVTQEVISYLVEHLNEIKAKLKFPSILQASQEIEDKQAKSIEYEDFKND